MADKEVETENFEHCIEARPCVWGSQVETSPTYLPLKQLHTPPFFILVSKPVAQTEAMFPKELSLQTLYSTLFFSPPLISRLKVLPSLTSCDR